MIHIENASIGFHRKVLWKNINLSVPTGTCAAVLGLSGSGKSVLLKSIAGLMQLWTGTIRVTEQPLSMVFQQNALFDTLSILDNLIFTCSQQFTKKDCIQQAHQLLEEFKLIGAAHLLPSQISGGMQKRAALARTIITRPKTILYDEPTAGLDPINTKGILEHIKTFHQKNGITSLCITNHLHTALQLADTIYLIHETSLIYAGTPSTLKHSSHPAVQQYLQGSEIGPLTKGWLYES